MKKILSYILCLGICFTLIAYTPSVYADEITVELDGAKIEFDVEPEIIDGRTMVPVRKIFEEIGAFVKWDGENQKVSARKNSKTITLTIGSGELSIDKGKTDDEGNPIVETVSLDVPPQIVSGRTLVPARAISESFGLNVDWDKDNKKVSISSDEKEDNSWEENKGSINLNDLTFDGKGIEIKDNQIKITEGGDFTLNGTLSDGNIIVSAKEKVKLRLSGVKITSGNNPCIFVEKADKSYITLTEDTENILVAQNSEDGAIYSKENLEIKGKGSLEIESKAGHGIKASDNLNIENGTISIKATGDGIHINDTFKMKGGKVSITSIGDGIDCESIIDISGGTIDIETIQTPIETTQDATNNENASNRRPIWEEQADVEFEKSTKGINSEWMMVISGGEINVDSSSHAIHCEDEMQIYGGKITLSSKYDKGISAHGDLTIDGEDTKIDVLKSTEGIESKNVLTINNGMIKVVSSDDALNATGGKSGMMMPGGNFGGNDEGGKRLPTGGDGKIQGNRKEQNTDAMNQNQRPQRGENGWFASMNPDGKIPERGEFAPPENFEGKEFTPPFDMNERGDFAPPFEKPENGGFTPQPGNRPQMNEGGMFAGGMGGFGRDMKECLIINGGYLELCGNDDCIDSNGNLTINGGTVKAANPSGAFTGNFGVLDADGKITIKENANIILAAGSGRNFSAPQNSIIVYCENNHTAEEKITVSDKNGNVIYEYAPQGNFKAVLIASNDIKTGEKYVVTVGDESFETEIAEKSTVIGTQQSGGMQFGRVPKTA